MCPSFLKRVMPQRWFQDWGPGSRSQSPTHEEGEKFRPCGKPTSVIRGVSEPPATSPTAPNYLPTLSPELSAQIRPEAPCTPTEGQAQALPGTRTSGGPLVDGTSRAVCSKVGARGGRVKFPAAHSAMNPWPSRLGGSGCEGHQHNPPLISCTLPTVTSPMRWPCGWPSSGTRWK